MARAKAYQRMGHLQDAELFYRNAISQFKAAPTAQGLGPLLGALEGLAQVCEAEGRNAEAEDILLQTAHLRENAAGPQMLWDVRMLGLLGGLQNLYRQEGRLEQMEPLYQRTIELQRKYLDPHDRLLSFTLLETAQLYAEENKFTQSLPMYQQALALLKKSSGDEQNRSLLPILNGYAEALDHLGRSADAAELRAQASEIEHRHTAQSQPNR